MELRLASTASRSTPPVRSPGTCRQTEFDCKEFITQAEKVSTDVVAECKLLTSTPLCEVLNYLGRQRFLIQKVATDAVLVGLELNLATNK